MTGQKALTLIDRLLQADRQKGLNDLQSAILLSVWEGQSYQMLADRLDYEVDYIKSKRDNACKLTKVTPVRSMLLPSAPMVEL
jgi:hypothetical protein